MAYGLQPGEQARRRIMPQNNGSKKWIRALMSVSAATASLTGLLIIVAGCGSTSSDLARPAAAQASPNPGASPSVLPATFTSINQTIIQPMCISCHSGAAAPRGVDLSTYSGVVAQVVPNNPDSSQLYKSVANGSMPPNGPALSSAQLQQITSWISAGAPNN
jgi:mono/diheme cytochrome c family protein